MKERTPTEMSAHRDPNTAVVGRCSITRDPPLRLAFLMAGTGGYIAAKWCASPLFYLARRAGWKSTWPRRLDASINRVLLPLTERADHTPRSDVTPNLRRGDMIPDISVRLPDGSLQSLRSFSDRPLLLVLVRGSWCPYSRLHMSDLDAALPRLEAANVRVLAVSSHADPELWRSWGIRIPVAGDPDGTLFDALGVRLEQWMETAWGRVLPYEGAFLFDATGRLMTADVRRVSGYHTQQTFLSVEEWLRIVNTQIERASQ